MNVNGFDIRRRLVPSMTIVGCLAVGSSALAAPPAHSVTGVLQAPLGAGATVTLSGDASAVTVADSAGGFSFSGLAKGTYVITPQLAGAVFTPLSSTVTMKSGDIGGVNFAAATGTLIFFDDFTEAALDPLVWTTMNRPGDPTNNEAECYQPANVSTSNGALAITAKVQPVTCGGSGFRYTSGMVQWTGFNFLYGAVEVRAKMTGGSGPWPSFWLLGSDCQSQNITFDQNGPCNWPNPGSEEIDIAEILGGVTSTVYETLHTNAGSPGCSPTTTDTSKNWHTYGLTWAPGSLTWTIDGAATCSITSNVPTSPMFLIMDAAVGGAGGGSIKDSTLPQTMQIDYVKITQQ